jgi:hypothetical protein
LRSAAIHKEPFVIVDHRVGHIVGLFLATDRYTVGIDADVVNEGPTMRVKLSLLAATAVIALFATTARAAPLTLDMDGTPSYQQTQNSPCVIGDPSCNNPAGFGSTTLAPATSTHTNILSPMYTVGQIRDLVGNTFVVGIDVNTTTQPLATEVLDSFELMIAGVTQFIFNTPTQLANNNNGNGWSDATLTGFDLTAFLDAASAQFRLTYHGATDGREQFFLASSGGDAVPEPAAFLLLGAGLLGAGALRRRKSK